MEKNLNHKENPMDIIETALSDGQRSLSEFHSKQVMKSYGIPVTQEILAGSAKEAVAAAEAIGYPVALKASSPELMHKSEVGAVELNLKSGKEIEDAYQKITGSLSLKPNGMLVQEMVVGCRELVLGLTREPQFGPCVMLGLGGVMTEIFQDIVIRVAPFDMVVAEDMLDELKSKAMLGEFRGQEPVDREALCRSLIAVGRIGIDHDAVAEIDINPFTIDLKGRVVAVDALVVLDSDNYKKEEGKQ